MFHYLQQQFFFNRTFTYILLGRFVSQLGDKLYLLALPWLVLDLTHSALQAGIVFAMEIFPEVILAPFIGAYVDRISRKYGMIIADILRGIVVGSITLLALTNNLVVYHLYIASFLLTFFTLLFDVAADAYLPSVLPKERLIEANAKLTFIATILRIIGPAISGMAIIWIGASGTVGLNALSFLISALFLSLIPRDKKEESEESKEMSIWQNIKEGILYLVRHEVLLPIAIFSTVMNIGIYAVTSLFVFSSKEVMGYNSSETALIFTVSGIFATIATMLVKRLNEKMNKGNIIRFGSFGVSLAILILVFNQSLMTVTISYSIILVIGIFVNVTMMSYRQMIVPNQLLGRVMTASRVITSLFVPFATVGAGWLAESVSVVFVFILSFLIVFFNFLYASFSSIKKIA